MDTNGYGTVNVADYLAFLALYSAGDARADVNGDAQINVADYLAFLAAYAAAQYSSLPAKLATALYRRKAGDFKA